MLNKPIKLVSNYSGALIFTLAVFLLLYSFYIFFSLGGNRYKQESKYNTYSNLTNINLHTYSVEPVKKYSEDVGNQDFSDIGSAELSKQTVYVQQGFVGDSDGSLNLPYPNLETALNKVSDGGVIVFVTDYTFTKPVTVNKNVTIKGSNNSKPNLLVSDSFICNEGELCAVLIFLKPANVGGVKFVVSPSTTELSVLYSNNLLDIDSVEFVDLAYEQCKTGLDGNVCNKLAVSKQTVPAMLTNNVFKGFKAHYQSLDSFDKSYTGFVIQNNYFSNAYNHSLILNGSKETRVSSNVFINNSKDFVDTESSNILIVGNFFYSPISLELTNTKDSYIYANSFLSASNSFSSVVLVGDNSGVMFIGPQDNTYVGNYWDNHTASAFVNEDIFSTSYYVGFYRTGDISHQVYDNKPVIGKNLITRHYDFRYSVKNSEALPGSVSTLTFEDSYAIKYKDGIDVVLENIFNKKMYKVQGSYSGPREISFTLPGDIELGNYRVGYYDKSTYIPTNVALVVMGELERNMLGLPALTSQVSDYAIPNIKPIKNIKAQHNLEDESLVITWDHTSTPGFEDSDVYHVYRTYYPKSRALKVNYPRNYSKTRVATIKNKTEYVENDPKVLYDDFGVYEYTVVAENIVTKRITSEKNSPVLEVYPFLIDTAIDLVSVGIGADTKNNTIGEVSKNNIQVGSNGIVDTYHVWSNKNQFYFKYVEGLTFYDFLEIKPHESFLISTERYKNVDEKYYIVLSGNPVDFPKLDFTKGFNNVLITHKHDKLVYASDLLNDVPGALSVVTMEYGSVQKYTKKSPSSDNFILLAGKGYFVEVAEDVTWQYSN